MTLKPFSRIVTHVDLYKRPMHTVRRELWDAAVEHLACDILAKGYSGKESVRFLRAKWPKVVYPMLKKSPSFAYSEKKFLELIFATQQTLAGPTYGLIDLMKAVESKIEMMNYIVKSSGSEGVIV